MNLLETLLRPGRSESAGSEGVQLRNVKLYSADFLAAPPTVTEGTVDLTRRCLRGWDKA